MPNKKTKKTRDTKTDILVTAREILQNEGLEKLSMRKISKRLGFTATSLYYHFKNKEEIIFELIKESRLNLASFMAKRIDGISDPLQNIYEMNVAYIEFGLQNPDDYRIMFMQPFPNNIASLVRLNLSDKIDPGIQNVEQNIIKLNPALKNSAIDIAHALWMMVHGYISVCITSRLDLVFDKVEVYKTVLNIIHQVILNPPSINTNNPV